MACCCAGVLIAILDSYLTLDPQADGLFPDQELLAHLVASQSRLQKYRDLMMLVGRALTVQQTEYLEGLLASKPRKQKEKKQEEQREEQAVFETSLELPVPLCLISCLSRFQSLSQVLKPASDLVYLELEVQQRLVELWR